MNASTAVVPSTQISDTANMLSNATNARAVRALCSPLVVPMPLGHGQIQQHQSQTQVTAKVISSIPAAPVVGSQILSVQGGGRDSASSHDQQALIAVAAADLSIPIPNNVDAVTQQTVMEEDSTNKLIPSSISNTSFQGRTIYAIT